MELASIEKLLDKYINSETTLKEEEILKKYFTSDDVAPHLQEMKGLFVYFKESKGETCTKSVRLKSKKMNFKWMSLVASVLLLVGVFVGKKRYDNYQQEQQFAQIKQALEMVSFNLNRGNDVLYAVSNNLTKGNNAINELNMFPKTISKANRILKK
ncbi:MAG: hypothetical protein KGV59_03485 [Tenacibaculum sp.]|nr:hypothetical protein [Tenacibaculum sp.]